MAMHTISESQCLYRAWTAVLASAVIAVFASCTDMRPLSLLADVQPRSELAVDGMLTLDQALVYGLANDPVIRAAQHHLSVVYWRKVTAAMPQNPALSVSVDPSEWALSLSAYVVDVMDLAGRRQARIDAAEAREDQQALRLHQLYIERVENIRRAYAEVTYRRSAGAALDRSIELLAEILSNAEQQQHLGELSWRTLAERRMQMLDARAARAAARLQQQTAEAELNRLLGLPMTAVVPLAPIADISTWQSIAAVSAGETNSATSSTVSLVARPELALLMAQARDYGAQVTLAQIEWIQSLEGGISLSQEDGEGARIGGGLSIELPIWRRGHAHKSRLQSQLAALEETMLATQANIIWEVHHALQTLRHAELSADTLMRDRGELLSERQAMAKRAQAIGEISAITVKMHDYDLARHHAERELADMRHLMARARLAAALGDDANLTPAHSIQQTIKDGS